MRKVALAVALLGLLGFVNIFLPRYVDVPYWFNHAMHFFGGFFSGVLSGAIMLLLLDWRRNSDTVLHFALACIAIFFGAIALGAIWEEFEYLYFSQEILEEWTFLGLYDDTLIDMKMNRWGASAALVFFTLLQLLKRFRKSFNK